MATPTLLPGNRFRLYRESGTPGTYTFVCIATTVTLTMSSDFEDATVPDCDTPTAIPTRKSIRRQRAWSLNFSGIVDADRFTDLRTDAEAEAAHSYQILVDKALADGGGTWTGDLFIESLEISKQDNGLVRFTAQARGDGALVWEDADA